MYEIVFEPLNIEVDEKYIAKELDVFGLSATSRIKLEMNRTPKSGRAYKRGSRTHRASRGGNFPAVDTGRLAASLGHDQGRNELRIGAGSAYAGYLQDGTSRMAARPFLDTGVDLTFKDWPDFLSDFLKVT